MNLNIFKRASFFDFFIASQHIDTKTIAHVESSEQMAVHGAQGSQPLFLPLFGEEDQAGIVWDGVNAPREDPKDVAVDSRFKGFRSKGLPETVNGESVASAAGPDHRFDCAVEAVYRTEVEHERGVGVR